MPQVVVYGIPPDYYHEKDWWRMTIWKSRSIRDDFGRNLMTNDYTEEYLTRTLLSSLVLAVLLLAMADKGIKIQPPME